MNHTAPPGGAALAAAQSVENAGRQFAKPTLAERNAFAEQGFFFRAAAFGAAELARLREAAERVVERANRALACGGRRYAIDGNTYVDVELDGRAATVQLEHTPD